MRISYCNPTSELFRRRSQAEKYLGSPLTHGKKLTAILQKNVTLLIINKFGFFFFFFFCRPRPFRFCSSSCQRCRSFSSTARKRMRTAVWRTCCWRNRISSSWPTRSPDSCSSTSSGPSSELGSGPSPFPSTGIGRGRGGRFPARPEPWSEPYSPTSFRSFSFISSWRSKPNLSKLYLFWNLWNGG